MRKNQLFLPINLERIVEPNASVRMLEEICSELDYTNLNKAYGRKVPLGAATPDVMFEILVYGYMTGNYSSRKIEKCCKENINFMWLLDGLKAPSKSKIARFRDGNSQNAIEELFSQLINKLHELEEIECKNLFVDGTKIEANANKYSFVWQKTVLKNLEKLDIKILKLLDEINERYNQCFADIYVAIEFLEKQKEKNSVEFVYGKGQRKLPLQRDYENLSECRDRLERYIEYNSIFDGRNNFSKTDKDATFMHMKEDHMRNGQLKAGYNVQIGVDSEYIVNVGIFSDRADQLTLIPFLEDTESKTNIRYKEIVADAGYESEENYVYLNNKKQESYIKPSNYEVSKKRNKNKYATVNFQYNAEEDIYVCPENNILKPIALKHSKGKSGYISEKTIYGCEACKSCPSRDKCTEAKEGRKLQRAKLFTNFREQSLKNITSPKGIELRMNRSIQVEGAFGVLKQDYGFRRFLTRGKRNVKTEMLLLCFAYNINKLHSKTVKKRRKTHLFEKMTA